MSLNKIEYECRESSRARSPRITVHPDGRVVVTKPIRISQKHIDDLLARSETWIHRQQARFAKLPARLPLPKLRRNTRAYKVAREEARALVQLRLAHFNKVYGFQIGTISIRDQKTRWGSCSAKGNLSFNYRIVFLPQELADYLIVHELSHIQEHNHSTGFWDTVAHTIPNHRQLRKRLHSYTL